MNITKKQIGNFQQKIFSFYEQNKRDLPWRKTTDAYKILLSEFMLQQTQVNRVQTYYTTWIQKWPTIQDLASASKKDILKEWMGLGYNSRAINLQKTAQIISEKYEGDVLTSLQNFKELPGIGPYTCRAVRIFSQNVDDVTVDTNIRRIFIHEFNLSKDVSDTSLWEIAKRCLPVGKSRDWHNALMDYGATYLTARKTKIPAKTKQSTFEGSDRQIRAQILRLLLEKPVSCIRIQKTLKISSERLKKILKKMCDEQLIHETAGQFKIIE